MWNGSSCSGTVAARHIYMYARLFSSRCCGISMVVDAGITYLSSYRILRVSCHTIGAPSEDISCLRQNVV